MSFSWQKNFTLLFRCPFNFSRLILNFWSLITFQLDLFAGWCISPPPKELLPAAKHWWPPRPSTTGGLTSKDMISTQPSTETSARPTWSVMDVWVWSYMPTNFFILDLKVNSGLKDQNVTKSTIFTYTK